MTGGSANAIPAEPFRMAVDFTPIHRDTEFAQAARRVVGSAV